MMNLRCLYCQTPFTLGRVEMLSALVSMNDRNQNHYDAHCPRCRRANSISRQRMELFFPNWKEAAKQQQAAAASATAAPNVVPAAASLKTEPLPKASKGAAAKSASKKETPAASAKTSETKPSRASKPASAKKTTPSSKPAPSKSTKTSSKDSKKK